MSSSRDTCFLIFILKISVLFSYKILSSKEKQSVQEIKVCSFLFFIFFFFKADRFCGQIFVREPVFLEIHNELVSSRACRSMAYVYVIKVVCFNGVCFTPSRAVCFNDVCLCDRYFFHKRRFKSHQWICSSANQTALKYTNVLQLGKKFTFS